MIAYDLSRTDSVASLKREHVCLHECLIGCVLCV